MLYSTKQKLYNAGTILAYVLVCIVAILGALFAVFKVFIPGREATAVVRVSADLTGSYYDNDLIGCYFFVDKNDRVNLTAGNSDCGEVLTNKIRFKNYKIEDAVKHYTESASFADFLSYERTVRINVTIYTPIETDHIRKMANSITETTNEYFASIGLKYATVVTISENVKTPISALTGFNAEITGESQVDITKSKQEALNKLISDVRATKSFTFNNRVKYYEKYRELLADYEEDILDKNEDERKESEDAFNGNVDYYYDLHKDEAKSYKSEVLANYDNYYEGYKQHHERYLSTFELSDNKQETIEEVKAYQESVSIIYEIESEKENAEEQQ